MTFRLMALFTILCGLPQAIGCTAFQLQSQEGARIYCRSLEFGAQLDSNFLIVPHKTPFTGTAPNRKPGLQWTATYGHVGMNQSMEPTMVSDGMNEKGLIVSALYLPGYAQYEQSNPGSENKTLGAWEVPSYLLATCATIQDVKNALAAVIVADEPQPVLGMVPLHFYITDSSGSTVIVEYLDGKRHLYDNPLGVLTNSPPFPWQLINLGNFVNLSPENVPSLDLNKFTIKNFGQGSGLLGLPGDYTPPSRFVRAALYANWAATQKTAEETVNLGFHILNTFDIFSGIIRPGVAENSNKPTADTMLETTQWVIVHDQTNLKSYFRGYEGLNIQMVDLKKIDFTQAGMREIPLSKTFAIEDVTSKSQNLSAPSS